MRDTKSEILHFWFVETDPSLWFQKNEAFDERIRDRFKVTYEMAADGLCNNWAKDADGALALIVVLDQFPRNMFRGTGKAYASDSKALICAKQAIHKGFDQVLTPEKRRFMYLPFEHSENLSDQKRSVELFKAMEDVDPLGYTYALRHYDVIKKFSRFPHRNEALGRDNTPEEEEYLQQAGAGF